MESKAIIDISCVINYFLSRGKHINLLHSDASPRAASLFSGLMSVWLVFSTVAIMPPITFLTLSPSSSQSFKWLLSKTIFISYFICYKPSDPKTITVYLLFLLISYWCFHLQFSSCSLSEPVMGCVKQTLQLITSSKTFVGMTVLLDQAWYFASSYRLIFQLSVFPDVFLQRQLWEITKGTQARARQPTQIWFIA